jgi:hypothetical protein
MARLAQQVLDEAVRAAGTADALAERMEPHVQKRYGNSAIYAYTNARAVPPGDALLAAALATGISLDEKLGLVRMQSEVERQVEQLRAEIAEMRGILADLGGPAPPPVPPRRTPRRRGHAGAARSEIQARAVKPPRQRE